MESRQSQSDNKKTERSRAHIASCNPSLFLFMVRCSLSHSSAIVSFRTFSTRQPKSAHLNISNALVRPGRKRFATIERHCSWIFLNLFVGFSCAPKRQCDRWLLTIYYYCIFETMMILLATSCLRPLFKKGQYVYCIPVVRSIFCPFKCNFSFFPILLLLPVAALLPFAWFSTVRPPTHNTKCPASRWDMVRSYTPKAPM